MLAIGLKRFTASNEGSRNKLTWEIETQSAMDKFQLERSKDGIIFVTIGEISSKEKTSSYTYWDESPFKGINYYRLKMIEANGDNNYSNTVSATVRANGVLLISAHPNPVTKLLTVRLSAEPGINANLLLMDVTGKLMEKIQVTGTVTDINMAEYAPGIYVLKYADDQNTQTIRINKN